MEIAQSSKIQGVANQLNLYAVPPYVGSRRIHLYPSEGFRDKGSHKNKFAILSVESPVWQGAKAQEYQDIPSFRNATGRDASALKM